MVSSRSIIARSSAQLGVPLFACLLGMSCSEHTRAGRNGLAGMPAAEERSPAPAVSGTGSADVTAGGSGGGSKESRVELPVGRGEVRAGGGATSKQGDAGSAGADGGRAVVLTAVVMSVSRNGALGIAAEWANHTDEAIFLQGCSTVEGWFLQDGQWVRHGAFALCAAETPAVEVGPGETYVDVSGAAATPPERGTNVWRLVGKYGVGCRRGALLGASQCAEIREVTSVNQIAWAP